MAVGVFTESNAEKAHYNGRLTFFVTLSCMMAATGGIIFGYDIGIAGGVTSMEPFLKKFFPEVYARMQEDSNASNYCKFNSQLLTSFTSSLYLAGLVASFLASSVTRSYGRKASMLVGGVAFLAGSAFGGAAVNVYMIILGRILLGVGVGFANQSVPLYLAEMPPPQYRGLINNGFQFCIGIGFITATLINFGTEKIKGNMGWRISLALASVPASLLTLAAILLPETPNNLLQRGADIQKATALLQKIRGTLDVDAEMQDIIAASNSSQNVNHPFREIIRPKYRPQLVMAVLIPFLQQATGINVIGFYAPVLFRSIGLGESAALLSAVATGVIGTGSTFVAMIAADKFGRRILFMIGGVQMLISQIMVGVILEAELKDHGGLNKEAAYSVLLLIGVYCAGFGWSWGPLAWLVPCEIFPLEIRSALQSVYLIVSFVFTFIIAQALLAMLCSFKAGIFYFFGGWVFVMTVFVYFFLPETKNIPIEKMAEVWRGHWFWKGIVEDGEEVKMDAPVATTNRGDGLQLGSMEENYSSSRT